MKNKKMHRKWWIWLVAVIVLLLATNLTGTQGNEAKEVKLEDGEEVDAASGDKAVDDKRIIEVDQEVITNSLKLEVQTATIERETITIPIWWKHWNMYDKAHLSLLAHPVVEQSGEELRLIEGEGELLTQKEQLTPARANLKYELISKDEPVTVRFLDIREEARDQVITINIRE